MSTTLALDTDNSPRTWSYTSSQA